MLSDEPHQSGAMADSAGSGISHVADSPKRDALRQPAQPRQQDREALSTPNETPSISSSRDIPDSARKTVGVVDSTGATGARPAASTKWTNDQLFYDDEGGDIGLPYDEDAGLISSDLVNTYSDNDTFAYMTNDTKAAYRAATKTEPRSYVVEDYMWEVNPPMSARNRRNVRPGDIILAPDPQQAYNPRTASGVPTHEGLVSNKLRPMTVMKTHEDDDNLPESATCLRHYTYQKKGPSNLMSVSELNKLFKLLERGSYEETSLTGNRPVYGSLFDSTIDPQAYIHGGQLVLVRLTNKVRIIGEINIPDWARLDIFSKQQGERSVDAVYAQYPKLREQAEQKVRETSIRARELQGDHHNTRAAHSRESTEDTDRWDYTSSTDRHRRHDTRSRSPSPYRHPSNRPEYTTRMRSPRRDPRDEQNWEARQDNRYESSRERSNYHIQGPAVTDPYLQSQGNTTLATSRQGTTSRQSRSRDSDRVDRTGALNRGHGTRELNVGMDEIGVRERRRGAKVVVGAREMVCKENRSGRKEALMMGTTC